MKLLFYVFYVPLNRSLYFEGECILQVCENKVLRKIFKPNKDDISYKWKKLNNEKICAFIPFSNIMTVFKPKRL
jgi:hypothetical protein